MSLVVALILSEIGWLVLISLQYGFRHGREKLRELLHIEQDSMSQNWQKSSDQHRFINFNQRISYEYHIYRK